MKKFIPIFLIFLVSVFIYADETEILWQDSYNLALKEARNLEKNLFTLITAPSWCGPCQELEDATLQDNNVITMLNKGFVPFKVLDTNEEEIARFDFEGYPTIIILDDSDENILFQYTGYVSADELLEMVEEYTDFEVKSDTDNTGADADESDFEDF